MATVLQIDRRDNVVVALVPLVPLAAGGTVVFGDAGATCPVTQAIPAKHKMALTDLAPGDLIRMYGMTVGEVTQAIPRGGLMSTRNVRHRADAYTAARQPAHFALPDATAWADRTFLGYHRADGQVGTRNYWLVLPLVFCENRNVERMREALEEELGYGSARNAYRQHVRDLVKGKVDESKAGAEDAAFRNSAKASHPERAFPNIDGIRFLTHQGGCGGTRQDAQALCGLLAGYIHHPNVAGATVLSLGCQNAEVRMLAHWTRHLPGWWRRIAPSARLHRYRRSHWD